MLLSFAMESLLQMCNDSDSDVRMTADESLNRIIRVTSLTFYPTLSYLCITFIPSSVVIPFIVASSHGQQCYESSGRTT